MDKKERATALMADPAHRAKMAEARKKLKTSTPAELLDEAGITFESIHSDNEYARKSACERLSQMGPNRRNGYLRALKGDSPAAAIKAFCLECVGWQKEEVKLCTAPACPLYRYRPFQFEDESY